MTVESSLQRALAKIGTLKASDAKSLKISDIPQDPKILAENRQFIIDLKARNEFFKKLGEALQAQVPHENNDINLPNITSLNLETAARIKGFVEADIEQGADKGHTIHGHYGDQQVNSLKDYLSLLNSYIAEKSG